MHVWSKLEVPRPSGSDCHAEFWVLLPNIESTILDQRPAVQRKRRLKVRTANMMWDLVKEYDRLRTVATRLKGAINLAFPDLAKAAAICASKDARLARIRSFGTRDCTVQTSLEAI